MMGKTLETKKKILNMLKERKMTVGEISKELGLSHATVSQHISELQNAGAIEKIDNEHFKKLKYYKAGENSSSILLKYAIGAVVIIALLSGIIYFYYLSGSANKNINNVNLTTVSNTISKTTNLGTQISVNSAGAEACPFLFYNLNGTIKNSIGFKTYYLNTSYGTVQDLIINKGDIGTLYVNETITNVLNESDSSLYNREHYVYLSTMDNSFNYSNTGINVSINPVNFTIRNNESLGFELSFYISQNAINQTYWLHIDGPCGGGVKPSLITIGNTAYSGNVTIPVVPFA